MSIYALIWAGRKSIFALDGKISYPHVARMDARMTPQEIEAAVRRADGSIASLCRAAGIATSTFGRWKRGETSVTLDVYDRIVSALHALREGHQNAL